MIDLSRIQRFVDNRFRTYYRTQTPSETVDAWVETSGGVATIHAGPHSYQMQGPDGIALEHDVQDFVLPGLAIISMHFNLDVRFAGPVSEDAAAQFDELAYASRIWLMPNLAPLRLHCTNVVPTPAPAATANRVMCLSGGIDSTAAAVLAKQEGLFSHALLIAGADYPTAQHPGYQQLRQRVARSAEVLEMQLIEVETSARKLRFGWQMLHALNLWNCLQFLSPRFSAGGYAMDNTVVQDLARHPWSNTGQMASMAGTRRFPIAALADTVDRVEKVRVIADHNEDLLGNLSVCWEDTSTGSNCGHCYKCVMTRLNFIAAGVDERLAFPVDADIMSLVPTLQVPKRLTDLRGALLRTTEIVRHLPEGDLRDLFEVYARQVYLGVLAHAPRA